jgi:cytoskeletal protein CcmA (bactofilin family)
MGRMFGGNSNKSSNGTDIILPQGSNINLNDNIETHIGSTASLTGELKAEGTIRIDGVFEGEIHTAANVIIGPKGKVKADIYARNVLVAGRVMGNINAHERLEIVASGGVRGIVESATFYLEEGAIFQGESRMPRDEAEDPAHFLLGEPK